MSRQPTKPRTAGRSKPAEASRRGLHVKPEYLGEYLQPSLPGGYASKVVRCAAPQAALAWFASLPSLERAKVIVAAYHAAKAAP